MLSATSRRRDSRWRPSSCFFKRSLSLGRACMHHAKRSPRALWTRVPRMAGEIWYWLGGTVASVWAGASPFRDRCARDSHLRPPPPSSFSCYIAPRPPPDCRASNLFHRVVTLLHAQNGSKPNDRRRQSLCARATTSLPYSGRRLTNASFNSNPRWSRSKGRLKSFANGSNTWKEGAR